MSKQRIVYFYYGDRSATIFRGDRRRAYKRLTLESQLRLANCISRLAELGKFQIRVSIATYTGMEL